MSELDFLNKKVMYSKGDLIKVKGRFGRIVDTIEDIYIVSYYNGKGLEESDQYYCIENEFELVKFEDYVRYVVYDR